MSEFDYISEKVRVVIDLVLAFNNVEVYEHAKTRQSLVNDCPNDSGRANILVFKYGIKRKLYKGSG